MKFTGNRQSGELRRLPADTLRVPPYHLELRPGELAVPQDQLLRNRGSHIIGMMEVALQHVPHVCIQLYRELRSRPVAQQRGEWWQGALGVEVLLEVELRNEAFPPLEEE